MMNPYPYTYTQHKMCGKNFIYALHECDIHCCWAQSLTHCLPALFMPLHDKRISNNWSIYLVSKPFHFTMVEAVEPFKLHPTSMSHTYIRCVGGTFSCCGWAYGCTQIPYHYHHRYLPRFERIGWNPCPWLCMCSNHATMLWVRLYLYQSTFRTASHIHFIHI